MTAENPDLDGFAPGSRPICGFCNAPWTDNMIRLWAEADLEYGYYNDCTVEGIDTCIDITCSSCERLIYRKEIRLGNNYWSAP